MDGVPQLGFSAKSSDFSASPFGPKKPTHEQILSAAQQFEGLLLHQLLKSASSEDGGWLGTGEEDTAGLQAMDLAQEQFAAALAARGGLGLAQLVIPQLTADANGSQVESSIKEGLNGNISDSTLGIESSRNRY